MEDCGIYHIVIGRWSQHLLWLLILKHLSSSYEPWQKAWMVQVEGLDSRQDHWDLQLVVDQFNNSYCTASLSPLMHLHPYLYPCTSWTRVPMAVHPADSIETYLCCHSLTNVFWKNTVMPGNTRHTSMTNVSSHWLLAGGVMKYLVYLKGPIPSCQDGVGLLSSQVSTASRYFIWEILICLTPAASTDAEHAISKVITRLFHAA